MTDVGPPLGLIAAGLVLWLAVHATIAGISIQTIGLILFLVGVVWLLIELVRARGWRRRDPVVRDRPIARERDLY
jgi:membrane protein implicated in regulation of membrane protease activity